ncbi:MarR family winged helix-turn-helix transcriptional regulator [Leifsonia sp. Leaf264]|uniref:MarR family winged helix-turn-helix transcriptional regulator n=1 Tax=Leifsonia sp. Leaf264 TaxID=1736314 RepID=UPI0006FFBD8D|nr:MarR family transcriptional regulator [Leifsonia sp. Leaf264]KQO96628.1 MarR family transcriptional regulator [Leifsonia sp. Leaf264]
MTIPQQSSLLRMSTFRLARRLRAEKSDDSVSDAQFAVLATLSIHGAHTLSALAERERVSAPSMNRTVNCLEEAGHLARAEDADDRRKTNISLTASGAELVKATVSKRDAWLTAQLRELTVEERDLLARAAELMGRLATQ